MEGEEERIESKHEPTFSERYVGDREELEALPLERNGVRSSDSETSQRKPTKGRIYTKGPAKNRRTKQRIKSSSSVKAKRSEKFKTVNRPLAILLLKHTYHHLLIACFICIIVETSRFAQPFLILIIIRKKPPTQQTTQYACAIGIILHVLLQALLITYNRHLTDVIAIKIKVLLNRIVYTKVPRLTNSSQSDLNVIHLSLSSDVDKLCQALSTAHSALVGTLSLITSSCVLLAFYGTYSLPSLGVVLLTVLLRIYLSAYHGKSMIQAISWTRGRLLHLSELIYNFNVIKINCSENVYRERLTTSETREFPLLHRAFVLSGLNLGIGYVTTRLAIYITIVTLAREGHDMSFEGLLLLVSFLHTLEFHGITRLPLGVGSLTYAIRMIQRLQESLDEKTDTNKRESEKNVSLDDPTYSFNNNTDAKTEAEAEQLILTKAPTSYSTTEHTRGRRHQWIWLYFLSTGPGMIIFPIILLLAILSETTGIAGEWWISKCRENFTIGAIGSGIIFTNESFHRYLQLSTNGTLIRHISKPLAEDLGAYAGLSLSYVIFYLLTSVLFVYVIIATLNRLLLLMRSGILNTKTSRLTHIHSGAILEAFGSDFHYLYETGACSLYVNFTHAVRVVCCLIFSCAMYPWVTIPTFPYIIGLILLKLYMREKIQHIEEKEHELQENLLKGSDNEHQASWETSVKRHLALEKHKWYSLARTRSWLRLKINLFTSLFCACVILQLVSCSQKFTTRGVAGLLYVYMSMLLLYIQDIIADTNMFTNCVKRMQAIASLPAEAVDDEGTWCDWPSTGSVNFTHVKLPGCVHETPVECDIPSGIKVGLLASEGSCRHGFVSALLSLEDHIGSARIDNLDTAAVNVHTLRTGVTVIHKNLLMKGITLRRYLDPKGDLANGRIAEVFEQVGLKRAMATVSLEGDLGNLDKHLNETNLNNLCVARALLHGSKVVVIWEDSTETDRSVDSSLQYVIRQNLPDATRIKVTPSVRSVITCDSILVMEGGKLETYPSAWRLLAYKEGMYERLVEEVGPDEAARIKALTMGFYRDRIAMDTIEEGLEEEEEDVDEMCIEEQEEEEDAWAEVHL